MTSKQALETLKDIAIYEENNNMCSDLGDCCDFKGELVEVYEEEVNDIEKDLDVLEIIKKGFSKNFLAERLKDAYLRNDLNDEDYETIENWEWLEK